MQTKQTIAIIGAAGKMGSAIARSLSFGNYRLLLYSTDLAKSAAVVENIKITNPASEVEAILCNYNACWEADIIIMAVPYHAEKGIVEKIKDVANQKIVISITNPLNETFDGLLTAPNTSAAEELQFLLPHSKVIKAFNTTFAANFETPVIDGKITDSFIAGDDAQALETVAQLVSTAGFNPIIAGELAVSRTLEAMQLLLIRLGLKYKYDWLAGWKILHH